MIIIIKNYTLSSKELKKVISHVKPRGKKFRAGKAAPFFIHFHIPQSLGCVLHYYDPQCNSHCHIHACRSKMEEMRWSRSLENTGTCQCLSGKVSGIDHIMISNIVGCLELS